MEETHSSGVVDGRTFDQENAALSIVLGVLLHFGKAELSVAGTTELHWSAGAITITPDEAALLRSRGLIEGEA